MDLSRFFALQNWPVLLLCVLLIVAAAIDFWKLKVPNKLTYPMILSGWLYGVGASVGWLPSEAGGVWASVVLSFLGLGLLLPIYAIGGMGAGDVKMQAGFGAWVGAIFGFTPGFETVLYGFFVAVLVGGVIALGMMFWRGDFFRNRKNVHDIVRDWFKSSSVYEVAEKAAERKPQMHLLPYGVPLCIGFISYMLYAGIYVGMGR